MKTEPLSDLFEVTYGNKFDLNKMIQAGPGEPAVNFVSRSSENNGVSARILRRSGVTPYPAGTITVSLGGSKLLSAFVQEAEFYTAQNVAVLRAKAPLTFEQKLFICVAIRHNRFRYSAFGREANRTIRSLQVPSVDQIPSWLGAAVTASQKSMVERISSLKPQSLAAPQKMLPGPDYAQVQDLFEVTYGSNLELNKLRLNPDGINFVSRTQKNNGVSARVCPVDGEATIKGPVLSVAGGGSVLETFLQQEPFYSGRDLYVLKPRLEMTVDQLLFYCYCIRANKFRYSYGRQANRTLKSIVVPHPSSLPEWVDGAVDRVTSQCEEAILEKTS